MTAGPNPYKTHTIGAGNTGPDVEPIEATITQDHLGRPCIFTVWEPSQQEINYIIEGKRIWMCIMCNVLPPACIIVQDECPLM